MFVGPTLLVYFAFAIYPVLVTFYNSVHTLRMDLGMQSEFVGLEHFREIVLADDIFWKASRNSLTWAVAAPLVRSDASGAAPINRAAVMAARVLIRIVVSLPWAGPAGHRPNYPLPRLAAGCGRLPAEKHTSSPPRRRAR